MSSSFLHLYFSSLDVWDDFLFWMLKTQYEIFPLVGLSSRVMSNDLGFLLASWNILFSPGLHVEINTSHSYHNINSSKILLLWITHVLIAGVRMYWIMMVLWNNRRSPFFSSCVLFILCWLLICWWLCLFSIQINMFYAWIWI
jgi:hypothetical protein